MKGRFAWFELQTPEVQAARDFYARIVGWKFEEQAVGGGTYTLLQAPGGLVGGIAPPASAAGAGRPAAGTHGAPGWLPYVLVDSLETSLERLRVLGGTLPRPPQDIPGGGRRTVAADPQGARFVLYEPAGEASPPDPTVPGNLGWCELHTVDWPGAWTFYSALFGWTRGDVVDLGTLGSYQLFEAGGTRLGALFSSPAVAQGAPFWLCYFGVDDIEAASAAIPSAGGRVLSPPHEVPGGGWIVQASDPQGAVFALLGRAP